MGDRVSTVGTSDVCRAMGLLETLQCRVGCMYLSDLRAPSNQPFMFHALRKIDAGGFALQEWNDAVRYLTGDDVSFNRVSDAYDYLVKRC